MSLIYPLGLLGLIGIPVLILIYIIKNKYSEQTIPSTYLWELSEKFLKRRNPINKLAGIISLILQIFAVIFISVAIAHPVFAIPGSAFDYCFILDGSGSMNITSADGTTRLDAGKQKIREVISGAVDGCTFTLVYAGENTSVIYEGINDKEQALKLLDERCAPSYVTPSFTYAFGAAQEYFNNNPAIKTYLITDKSYGESENVEVINVSSGEENYGVSGVEFSIADGKLTVSGNAVSYENDAVVTVEIYLDGEETPAAAFDEELKKSEVKHFTVDLNREEIGYVCVRISNADALALDNEMTVYNDGYENAYKVLIVSDTPFLLQAALIAQPNAQVEHISTENYAGLTGYDLYVFDSYCPSSLPDDGAVWFFNPGFKNTVPQEAGFSVQEGNKDIDGGGLMTYSTSSFTTVRTLLDGLLKTAVPVSKYDKCNMQRPFTTLMYYNADPVLFTGENVYGNNVTVFAFSLHDTSLSLMPDFIPLISNLLGFVFPGVVDETAFFCGDTLKINIASSFDSVRLETPSGNIYYLDTDLTYGEHVLNEVGEYTVIVKDGDAEKSYHVYASLPEEERFPTSTEASFSLQGEASNVLRDGTFSDVWMWFLILAVVAAADWMVYCYEQYQLR